MAQNPAQKNSKSGSGIFPHQEDKDALRYDLSQFTVLLAEDSRPMQTLVSSMLRSFGVREVLVCDGGDEAISLLTITQARKKSSDVKGVDLVITDWMMPDGSGLELLEWIRTHEADNICYMPVILLSAYTTHKVITAARDNGAHEALVKPVSGSKLAARILSVIDNPRPFIKTEDYFGPDRRRQDMKFEGENKRKNDPEKIKVSYEQH